MSQIAGPARPLRPRLARKPPPVCGPMLGAAVVLVGCAVALAPTCRVVVAVDPLGQARFTSYPPALVCPGTWTSAVSRLRSGCTVTVPNAWDVTVAGTLLSPQS